jgi:hypothetical protein
MAGGEFPGDFGRPVRCRRIRRGRRPLPTRRCVLREGGAAGTGSGYARLMAAPRSALSGSKKGTSCCRCTAPVEPGRHAARRRDVGRPGWFRASVWSSGRLAALLSCPAGTVRGGRGPYRDGAGAAVRRGRPLPAAVRQPLPAGWPGAPREPPRLPGVGPHQPRLSAGGAATRSWSPGAIPDVRKNRSPKGPQLPPRDWGASPLPFPGSGASRRGRVDGGGRWSGPALRRRRHATTAVRDRTGATWQTQGSSRTTKAPGPTRNNTIAPSALSTRGGRSCFDDSWSSVWEPWPCW